jgi:phosphatidylglycerophosphate synthase
MRKIPREYENIFDNTNIDISESLCPLFKKLNFTPNGITTLSLILGLISLWFLWNYNMVFFGIFYYLSYLFDCMDGHYARKYKQTSPFGDMYDHIKDVLVNITLIGIILYRYRVSNNVRYKVIIAVSIIFLLMLSHLGCQEKIYARQGRKESSSLAFTKKLCPGDPESSIMYTKWFGCGTWTVLIILIILYLNYNRT